MTNLLRFAISNKRFVRVITVLYSSGSQSGTSYTHVYIKSKSSYTTDRVYMTFIWAASVTQLTMIAKNLILLIFCHIFHSKLN